MRLDKGDITGEIITTPTPAPPAPSTTHSTENKIKTTSFTVGDVVALRSDPGKKGVVIAAIPLGDVVQ